MPSHTNNIASFRVLKLNSMPLLPPPSKKLLEIFSSASIAHPNYCSNRVRSRKEKQKRKSKINGFIAFRSFHSRVIKSSRTQQEISTSLAKVWELEPNREVWNYYALLYNETAKGEDFLCWLYRNLGIVNDANHSMKQISKINKSHFLSKIEDVFLQKSSTQAAAGVEAVLLDRLS